MEILNIAHRGASGYYPENTLLAFYESLNLGADGIETDVQITKDNIPVLIHDEKVNRTTNGIGYVKDYTYQELKILDAGIRFGNEFKGQTIPTLDELLDFAKDKNLIINLELKNSIIDYPNIEEIVLGRVKQYNLESQTIISSFNHYSMKKFKELAPYIKVGLLYDLNLYEPQNYAKNLGADAIHPSFYSLDSKILADVHKENISINTYTVNHTSDMKHLIELGVDSIITNYPDKLKKVLETYKKIEN